jgi:cell division protein FtsW (lipid II flippase)
MIANLATILVGLWLVYRTTFAIPPGDTSQIELVAAGVVVILLVLWARRTDVMRWHSWTNGVLAAVLLLLAAARGVGGVGPLASFWMILLIGIAVAVTAMWSMLYRPKIVQAPDTP